LFVLLSQGERRIRKLLEAATTPLHSQGVRRIRKLLNAATTPLHPTSRILIYLLAALVIPGLPFFMLPVLLLLALLILSLQRRAPFRLVWRTRWLLLVMVLGYAYSLPGEPVWLALGNLAPSWEGFVHGVKQAARLMVLLLWLDILVLRQPVNVLLAGLFQLMRPLSSLGIDPRRAALRLGLTLRAIEDLERGRGNLRGLLKLDFQVDVPQQIQLRLSPFHFFDVALPVLFVISVLGVGLLSM
jgi:energy-coupling factor transporter transmembrane protein EcfT